MIQLTKLKNNHLVVMLEAVKANYDVYTTFVETLNYKNHRISQSILKHLAETIFDKIAKIYKQDEFKLKLQDYQAILLNDALINYRKNAKNEFDKNTVLGLILMLDPQTPKG